ncbi:MAG: ankyrin repeat domain-containing protein [Candidatus Anstonellales archaeon]
MVEKVENKENGKEEKAAKKGFEKKDGLVEGKRDEEAKHRELVEQMKKMKETKEGRERLAEIFIDSARKNDVEVMKIMLEAEIDPNWRDKERNTALIRASETGAFYAVELLLKLGAKVNARNQKGETALMKASYSGDYDILNLLLDYGADAGIKSKEGNTALHYAVLGEKNHYVIKTLLFRAGVNPFLRNMDGKTALDLLDRVNYGLSWAMIREYGRKLSKECNRFRNLTVGIQIYTGLINCNKKLASLLKREL